MKTTENNRTTKETTATTNDKDNILPVVGSTTVNSVTVLNENNNSDKNHEDNEIMNHDHLVGRKLIETAAKQLFKKFNTISKETWLKESIEFYEHNERFDNEPVSLSWFTNRIESIVASKYQNTLEAKEVRSENEDDFKEFKILKETGVL